MKLTDKLKELEGKEVSILDSKKRNKRIDSGIVRHETAIPVGYYIGSNYLSTSFIKRISVRDSTITIDSSVYDWSVTQRLSEKRYDPGSERIGPGI